MGIIKSNVIAEQKNDLDNLVTVSDSYYNGSGPSFSNLTDSTQNLLDSLLTDTTKVVTNEDSIRIWQMSQDSTARLEQFKFSRTDSPILSILKKRTSPFFVMPRVTRTVKIDSTGNFVIITEKVNGIEIKPNQRISLAEYIKRKKEAVNKKIIQDEGYKYTLSKGRDELSDLFTDLTNIVIPLPSSDVFSIFGKNEINIRINGAVDIYGAWKTEETEGLTASAFGNTKSTPDFKQTVQINVDGSIGDKLKIGADWNTERTFEFENQLKLKYTGYEDEIIQSIEAGNVSLQTTPLIGGSEALFGIKAKFKFGPFSLTALASQKKGKVEELSISGGSTSKEFTKRLYDYAENHYLIDDFYYEYATELFTKYYQPGTFQLTQTLREREIIEIEVYKQEQLTGVNSDKIVYAKAFISLSPIELKDYTASPSEAYKKEREEESQIAGEVVINTFKKLIENTDYTINYKTGHITFKTAVERDKAIAIAYRTRGKNDQDPNDDYVFGEFENFVTENSQDNRRILKLVKIDRELIPTYKKAWNLQLRNIYPIGGRGVKSEGFVFDIKYEKSGSDPVNIVDGKNLLEVFGLDKVNTSGAGGPDGIFDFGPHTIDQATGEIIFASLRPFSEKYLKEEGGFSEKRAQELSYDAIYDTTKTGARNLKSKDKFILTGESAAATSSSYNIGFNVVENSVKVVLNGNVLEPGIDYTVDYMMGQVDIRNAAALSPGADLKITFEQNDLFSLASKTLFGFRGLLNINKDTKFGFSYLSLSQKSLSDKVRIGEEPLSNTIYGVDFSTKIDLPIVTKGINQIWSTGAKSEFTFSGEFAYMNPDPNTKKSKIAGDGGSSIAYIDDFEGSKKTIPVQLSAGTWKDISIPIVDDDANESNEELFKRKAMAIWYTPIPSGVYTADIWGDRKQVGTTDDQVTVMDLKYYPEIRGRYNGNPNLNDKTQNWSGMMTSLSSSASNLEEENMEYIEFWMNVRRLNDQDRDQSLYVDLGEISEDIIPNNILDFEDKNFNDVVDAGEDVGLDGKLTVDETNSDPKYASDPMGDDYDARQGYYEKINGTEGNSRSADIGNIPDTEDLNNNRNLDNVNSFFRYKIKLFETEKKYVAGEGYNKDWIKIRIPLRDPTRREIGGPSLSVAKTIRFWLKGAIDTMHLSFTDINIVGNQWQKVLTNDLTSKDSTLLVKTINYEDNTDYKMPPGVEREKDRANTQNDVYKNEQSLWLEINDLQDGDKREIIKYLFKPLDVFNYKKMKLFVRGDEDDSPGRISNYIDPTNYATEMYFRFGVDTSNYYEYRQPIKKGKSIDRGWEEIIINFDNLTAIKQAVTNMNELYSQPVKNKPGHKIGVKGQPSLTKIKFFLFGIVNPKNKGLDFEKVSGDLWLNELRVLDAEDSQGWAYKFASSLKLADLAKVSFNMSEQDPYFHKLADRFGSRNASRNWGVSANLDIVKLMPFSMPGSKLNIQYSHTESSNKPIYRPGTDINVDSAKAQFEKQKLDEGFSPDSAAQMADEFKLATETENISDSWTISNVQFKIPSKKWYFTETINKLTFGFTYNRTQQRSPTVELGKKWRWKANFGYKADFSRNNNIKLAEIPILGYLFTFIDGYNDARFYYTPQSFGVSFNANRNWSYSLTRGENARTTISRDFTAVRSMDFAWKITERAFLNLDMNYKVTVNSSYAHYLVDQNEIDRPENVIWQDIFNGPIFGKDTEYRQTVDFNLTPKLPSFFDLQRNVNLRFSYTSNYNWRNDLRNEDSGVSAGYDTKLSASLAVKLQNIGKKIFPEFKESQVKPATKSNRKSNSNRGRSRGRKKTETVISDLKAETSENKSDTKTENNVESLAKKDASKNENEEELLQDELELDEGPSILSKGLIYLQKGIQWAFFDYKNISLNFNESRKFMIPALHSKVTGFSNFWGFSYDESNGPSREFMLGFSSGDFGLLKPNLRLNKALSVNNNISMKTSRELWKGAKLDISWNVTWGKNDAISMATDGSGRIIPEETQLQTSTRNLDKTYLALPLGSNIDNIKEAFTNSDISDPRKRLEQAFSDEMGSIPGISNIVKTLFSDSTAAADIEKYFPRPNWRFSWSGLEKISFLSGIFSRLSLTHAFTSKYTAGWKAVPGDENQIQTQRVTTGFKPLIGVNFGLDKLIGGKLTGSIKYNVNTHYDVAFTNLRLTETNTNDIAFSVSYTKSGFELPLFGLALKNDITASLNYTMASNDKNAFDLKQNEDGTFNPSVPLDGTTRVTIEPKLKYVMSSKVTASVFYRLTTVEPKGASKVPATTTNEMGLEVHIAIK